MKKLLILLLLVGLVMGVAHVFAGPAHINGPGLSEVGALEAVEVKLPVSAIFTDIANVKMFGNFTGSYNNECVSSENMPAILNGFSPAIIANPNSQETAKRVLETQEVLPLLGTKTVKNQLYYDYIRLG